jgi:hypothetical protein
MGEALFSCREPIPAAGLRSVTNRPAATNGMFDLDSGVRRARRPVYVAVNHWQAAAGAEFLT